MSKTVKVLLAILLVVVLLGAGLFLVKPTFLQGLTRVPRVTYEKIPLVTYETCTGEWSEFFEASYNYDPPENEGGDRVDLAGITGQSIKNLAFAINSGCDMKIQFEAVPLEGRRSTTVTCDAIDIMDTTGSDDPEYEQVHVDCKFALPLPPDTGALFYGNGDHLYDAVAFWSDNGDPKLMKTRIDLANGDYVSSASSFFNAEWDKGMEWKIRVYLKK